MSVNGVTSKSGAADLYGTYNVPAKTAEKTETTKKEENNGVVYEPSKQTTTQKPSNKPDAN